MRKKRYHRDVERAQIVALHKNGLSQRQISKELGINRSSVQRAIKKIHHGRNLWKSEKMVGNVKQLHEMTLP